jgi:hypothetical protein
MQEQNLTPVLQFATATESADANNSDGLPSTPPPGNCLSAVVASPAMSRKREVVVANTPRFGGLDVDVTYLGAVRADGS